jgi:hypothetical protein
MENVYVSQKMKFYSQTRKSNQKKRGGRALFRIATFANPFSSFKRRLPLPFSSYPFSLSKKRTPLISPLDFLSTPTMSTKMTLRFFFTTAHTQHIFSLSNSKHGRKQTRKKKKKI